MADKKINIRLGSKHDGSGFAAALKNIKSLTRGATDLKSAFSMSFGAIRGVVEKIGSVLSSSFRVETMTTQFKTLVGGIDEAREHMADLKALGDTPPFNLSQFAAASRALMVMTDGALGYKKSLELIGDAAAATGRPIEEMGQAVGRLYAFIRDGQPLSRAVMQLRNMGVITPEVAQKLQDMQAAGRSNVEIWAEVENALKRYNGAMKETENTGEGLIAAIKTRWDNIVRSLGDAFADTAKDGLGQVLDKMRDLEESDAIGEWADDAVRRLDDVAESAKGTMSVLGGLAKGLWTGFKATVGTAMAFAAGMDESGRNGEGWFNFRHGAAVAGEFWRREVKGEKTEDELALEREEREKRAARRAELRRARESAVVRREEEEQQRKITALKEGDVKRQEAAAKQAEIKAAQDAAKERDRLDRELHQKRMDDLKAEIAEQSKATAPLRAAAAAAKSEFDRAFAMFRDPSRAATEIGEEKDYQSDLDRLHKSANRYGGKWRIDELSRLMAAGDSQGVTDTLKDWRRSSRFSPEVEAMVRASAAERTRTTAEEELRKIEANTAGLATKLEELIGMKGS